MSFLSFFTQQTHSDNVNVLWSGRQCVKWQCSVSERLCRINGCIYKKKNQKKPAGTKTGVRDGTDGPAALPGCFLNDVGDFRLAVEFALHVLHWEVPKERKKTRLTLAPNRGSLGVLCELIQAQLWYCPGI